jgi:nucleoside-diphosphate-sugar epimerase
MRRRAFATKRYLITGGTGFIGSALARRLVKEGCGVRVLDNDLRGAAGRLDDIARRVELIQADVRDVRAVRDAVKGMDGVCHLAYLNGTEFFYTRPDLVLDIGVKGIVNVIDACIQEGAGELFLLSSSEVYQTPPRVPTDEKVPLSIPDPLNPRYSYGCGKIASELIAVNYGRRYFKRAVIVRPHNVYGPDMGWEHVIPQFILRMKGLCASSRGNARIKFPVQGTGNQTRAFVFIDDFIDGFMIAMKKGEHLGIYHIGTMEEIAIREVAIAAAQYFGRKAAIVPGRAAAGGTLRRCPDISKIKRLGYRPKVAFPKGFEITARWYDENAEKRPKASQRRPEHEKIYADRV